MGVLPARGAHAPSLARSGAILRDDIVAVPCSRGPITWGAVVVMVVVVTALVVGRAVRVTAAPVVFHSAVGVPKRSPGPGAKPHRESILI